MPALAACLIITCMGFRTYLEQQLEEYERVEQERMEERQIATRKILERMKTDDAMRSFEGNPSASLQKYDTLGA